MKDFATFSEHHYPSPKSSLVLQTSRLVTSPSDSSWHLKSSSLRIMWLHLSLIKAPWDGPGSYYYLSSPDKENERQQVWLAVSQRVSVSFYICHPLPSREVISLRLFTNYGAWTPGMWAWHSQPFSVRLKARLLVSEAPGTWSRTVFPNILLVPSRGPSL